MTALIETHDLHALLQNQKVKIFDATYPAKDACLDVIPGAEFFDIDDICDKETDLPHMIPSPEVFQAKMQDFGINADDQIIVYDQKNIALAAARAWWMFRLFGHNNVKVLNGGTKKWLADGYDLMAYKPHTREKGHFTSVFHRELLATTEDIEKNIDTQKFQVLDARNNDRFINLQGHIPNSFNAFFMKLIHAEAGTLQSKDVLQAIFDKSGLDLSQKIATSCGSGVTACVLALALFELGVQDVAVYDGSWTAWSRRSKSRAA